VNPQPPPSVSLQPAAPQANAPTTAWLVSPPAGQLPLPPQQPAPSRHTLALAVVAAALLLVVAATATAFALNARSLHHQLSTVDADVAGRNAAQASDRQRLMREFQQADLSNKLQQVRSMTQAAQDALVNWARQGEPSGGIKTVQLARNACEAAVIDYDATAARFPADMLAGLPLRIDMNDTSTNCDRSVS